jgi:bacillithiol system protein YtxJ
MNWHPINSIDQLEQIKAASFITPQVIFKHSTTCSISRMAFDRFDLSIAIPPKTVNNILKKGIKNNSDLDIA